MTALGDGDFLAVFDQLQHGAEIMADRGGFHCDTSMLHMRARVNSTAL